MAAQRERNFISYHRSDLDLAGRVRQHLIAHGAGTWMDQFDIPAGAYWPDEIDKGLEAADTIVGVLSPEAVASRNVKNEWDWAIQNGKPLLLLQASPCVIPHRYVSINLIDATGGVEPALQALTHSLGLDKPSDTHHTVPTTHYARSGDYSIAYQVTGDGPVDLLVVPDFLANIDHFWKEPAFARVLREIALFSRLILFDKRGTGLSDRPPGISTLEERMDDMRAVMDAADSRQAVIYGLGSGSLHSALFAATCPDRTLALITWLVPAAPSGRTDYAWGAAAPEEDIAIDNLAKTIHEQWGTEAFAAEIIRRWAPSRAGDLAFRRWFAELMRLGRSPGAEIARLRMNMELDIRSVLPTIRVPTLVMYTVENQFLSAGTVRDFAEQIPNAQIAELSGHNYWPWFDDDNEMTGAMHSFIEEVRHAQETAREPESVLATILTVLSAGHAVGADANDAVDGLVNRESAHFRGHLIARTPDFAVLSFDGPARAIRCAAAIGRSLNDAGIESRLGLHTGEVMLPGDEAASLPARISRDIAGLAEPVEILVSSTVRDLVAGSGIRFGDHSLHAFDELADELRLFAVEQGSIALPPAETRAGA